MEGVAAAEGQGLREAAAAPIVVPRDATFQQAVDQLRDRDPEYRVIELLPSALGVKWDLDGPVPYPVTIRAAPGLAPDEKVVVRNLTFQCPSGEKGRGVLQGLTLDAGRGDALHIRNGVWEVVDCTLLAPSNAAWVGGDAGTSVRFERCDIGGGSEQGRACWGVFTCCQAPGEPASWLTMQDCTVHDCSSGVTVVYNSATTIEGCSFSKCERAVEISSIRSNVAGTVNGKAIEIVDCTFDGSCANVFDCQDDQVPFRLIDGDSEDHPGTWKNGRIPVHLVQESGLPQKSAAKLT
eukprot:m.490202 g.490202  ORF g.490202 m.490202 type:complete len:294 (+) comp27615_c0_seq1:304-1185(+)